MEFRGQYIEGTSKTTEILLRKCEKELESIPPELKSIPLRILGQSGGIEYHDEGYLSESPDQHLYVCIPLRNAKTSEKYMHFRLDDYSGAADIRHKFGDETDSLINHLRKINSQITRILGG